jgi:hypothetical protein
MNRKKSPTQETDASIHAFHLNDVGGKSKKVHCLVEKKVAGNALTIFSAARITLC